jgi:hypothetical protein
MNEEQINKEHTSPMERLYLGTFVVPTDAGLEVFGAIAVDADTGRITRTIEHRATAERLVDKSPTSFVVSELPSGCIALPAFHDGHIHALSSAVRRLFGIDLSECGSWEAAAAQLLTKYPVPAVCAFDEGRCDAAERRNWVATLKMRSAPWHAQATHNRSSEVDGSGAGFRRMLRFSVKPWMRYSARTGCSCCTVLQHAVQHFALFLLGQVRVLARGGRALCMVRRRPFPHAHAHEPEHTYHP